MSRTSLRRPTVATVGLLVPLAILDRRMQVTGGTGIIAFELAGPERSAEILESWGIEGRRAARTSLMLDFPYLVAYTIVNVRLAARAGDALDAQGARLLPRLAPVAAAIQVAAGACDAVENAALLGVVARNGDARLAAAARVAARAKFAGLTAGWLFCAIPILRWLR